MLWENSVAFKKELHMPVDSKLTCQIDLLFGFLPKCR